MATETEIERLVVRLVGESSDLDATYAAAVASTKDVGKSLQDAGAAGGKGLGEAKGALDGLAMSGEKTRKSLMLMSSWGGIPPEGVAMVTKLHYAFEITKGGVTGVIGSLGLLKGALAASGIGLAVLAIGAVINALSSMSKKAQEAAEASKSAFASVADGSRSIEQAMDDSRIRTMTEGLNELIDAANPGVWASIKAGVRGWFGEVNLVAEAQDRLRQRLTANAEAQRQQAADPVYRLQLQEAQQARVTGQVRDQTRALQDQAATSTMAEREGRRYATVQAYIRDTSVTAAQAVRRFQAQFNLQRQAEVTADLGRLRMQLAELNDEADRAVLGDVEGRIAGMAQSLLRANPTVGSLANAMRLLGQTADGTQEAMTRLRANQFARSMREQIETFGMSAERAQIARLRTLGLADANIEAAEAALDHLNALRALQQPYERLTAEETRATTAAEQQAEAQRQLALINRQLGGAIAGASELPEDARRFLEGGVAQGPAANSQRPGSPRPGDINFNPNQAPQLAAPAAGGLEQPAQAQQQEQQQAAAQHASLEAVRQAVISTNALLTRILNVQLAQQGILGRIQARALQPAVNALANLGVI